MDSEKKQELMECAELAVKCERAIARLRAKVNKLHGEALSSAEGDAEDLEHFYGGADDRLMLAEDYCNQANSFLKTAAEM